MTTTISATKTASSVTLAITTSSVLVANQGQATLLLAFGSAAVTPTENDIKIQPGTTQAIPVPGGFSALSYRTTASATIPATIPRVRAASSAQEAQVATAVGLEMGAWADITLSGTWAKDTGAQARARYSAKEAAVQARVKSGGAAAIATLAAAYRPAHAVEVPCIAYDAISALKAGSAIIGTDGSITLSTAASRPSNFLLASNRLVSSA